MACRLFGVVRPYICNLFAAKTFSAKNVRRAQMTHTELRRPIAKEVNIRLRQGAPNVGEDNFRCGRSFNISNINIFL